MLRDSPVKDLGAIRVDGARQNNLKGVAVRVPLGAVTAVTGVAGAGKSSLAFDVLYAEGYRRYVETFSPYARQFLERLDRPKAERIEGVLPSVAIDRTAPVRTSRSTVGTMTSVADYLRALYARLGELHCRRCGQVAQRTSAAVVFDRLIAAGEGQAALICFRTRVGKARPAALRELFAQAGLRRLWEDGRVVSLEDASLVATDGSVTVVLDRVMLARDRRQVVVDSLEAALRWGRGDVQVRIIACGADRLARARSDAGGAEPSEGSADDVRMHAFSEHLRCAGCGIDYADPTPAIFSFNNPVGACESCKGFGRTMDIDPDLVVPDGRLSIAQGCIKTFQSASYKECQDDLERFCRRAGLPADVPWNELPEQTRALIWEGEPGGRQHGARRDAGGSAAGVSSREVWNPPRVPVSTKRWYGLRGFFDWLQGRTYRMHVRVLLSRYRRYRPCAACGGARLKPEALLFRLAGRTLPELEVLPIAEADAFFRGFQPATSDAATDLLLGEIRGRLRFLVDVGLGYLTLARQSRTLSGGEAQRVSLATALGSSLTSTLYVLDEPSVGLHARDAGKLTGVLARLAAAGNAVVVVEHDPALIAAADHVIDLGPGPGREGGEVVYQGGVAGLLEEPRSRTGAFLAGRLQTNPRRVRREMETAVRLRVRGARENNLREVDVDLPLHRLVCVTGVSGSGKSTLVDQIIYRNLRRQLGLGESEPGACTSVEGAEAVAGVVLVDQTPLGASSRVNAATYLGVLDPLRACFAATPEAREAQLSASAFSFNSRAGACPTCGGAGYEKIELQFLPDAYVKCPACDGRRFRPEVLEIRCRGYDLAALLDLPAAEVARLFADNRRVVRALQPLLDIGLHYLALSQPAPTLSGGEAQRLKLAGHLAEAAEKKNVLYILDEPTTGLHASDVAVMLEALHALVEAGNSVVVVEHNLEVARAADWIIDLGPEGGDEGGRVVGEGPPERIATLDSHTGRALRAAPARATPRPAVVEAAEHSRNIRISGARENNLRDVSVEVPRNQMVAVTGVSGSGKSTLAFDVLYAEGQRRFLDCLPTYVRQFVRPLARPEVDRVEAVPPTVALEQKLSHGSSMSTVGTASEVYHYLRLLFAFCGVAHCPGCGVAGEVVAWTPLRVPAQAIAERIAEHFPSGELWLLAPLVRKRKGVHKEVLAAAEKRGVYKVRIDGALVDLARAPRLDRYTVHDIEAVADIVAPGPRRLERLAEGVAKALAMSAKSVLVTNRKAGGERFYSTGRACPACGSGLPVPDPRLFTFSQKFGACPTCEGRGEAVLDEEEVEAAPVRDRTPCADCRGTRLRPEALAIKVRGLSIGEVAAMSIRDARAFLAELGHLPAELQEAVLPELETRLRVLEELGLGYLTLDRGAHTLSTGEGQRIRVVAQLASNLRGVCYVLDEPTVGLHPRDSQALARALFGLRDRGNTVVVVEHEEALIRAADHLIDLGPGAGTHGGNIVAAGRPEEVARVEGSVTGAWLRGSGQRPVWPRRPLDGNRLKVIGARLHNLRDVSVEVPLSRLTCVTGVSGSGKSTLVREMMFRGLKARLGGQALPDGLRGLEGWQEVARALEVDEAPVGRTPRSVPATYVEIMSPIRELFAATPDARARGYKAGRFSFNVAAGRCDKCEGQGRIKVTMALLPDVYIPCAGCGGRRYNPDTLAVSYKGKSIAEVLELTVDQARELFAPVTAVRTPLDFLAEIGLGYLHLGQASPTLSGGEAQRMKLAAELARPGQGRSLYVLDEPTTGLHMADVARLVSALHRLVTRGDTVVVIEHNIDVVAASDCVIDLGPEGGEGGGEVVAWGTPEEVARVQRSRTAEFLRPVLGKTRAGGPRAARGASASAG
jgi:excinuclease ABC subunit A